MIPYGRQDISEADIQAVVDVLRSDFLTQGPAVPAFEASVAQYCGVGHAVAVSSATSALHLACLTLGVGKGDIVWTSPITFVASANCARYCGADVDFVDIDPSTYNLSVECLETKLIQAAESNCLPKVVIPVHLCGQSCDMAGIHNLGQRYGFKIIEDASHAIGGKYRGEPIGNCRYSNITVFSFHPVKTITTGEGGMIVTNDKNYFEKMRLFRSHGIAKPANHPLWYQEMIEMGYNYRITDIQAGLGLSQFKKLDKFLSRRQEIALKYIEAFGKIKEIILPPHQHWTNHAWHIFPIQLENLDRNIIYDKLLKLGIKCQIHYLPIHLHPYYQNKLGYRRGDFPNAEKYFSRCLTIPLFPAMNKKMVNKVIREITKLTS